MLSPYGRIIAINCQYFKWQENASQQLSTNDNWYIIVILSDVCYLSDVFYVLMTFVILSDVCYFF